MVTLRVVDLSFKVPYTLIIIVFFKVSQLRFWIILIVFFMF